MALKSLWATAQDGNPSEGQWFSDFEIKLGSLGRPSWHVLEREAQRRILESADGFPLTIQHAAEKTSLLWEIHQLTQAKY